MTLKPFTPPKTTIEIDGAGNVIITRTSSESWQNSSEDVALFTRNGQPAEMHFHGQMWFEHEPGVNRRNEAIKKILPHYSKDANRYTLWDSLEVVGGWDKVHAFKRGFMPVDKVPEDFTCFALFIPGEMYITHMWDSFSSCFLPTAFDGNVKAMLEKKNIRHGILLTLDLFTDNDN